MNQCSECLETHEGLEKLCEQCEVQNTDEFLCEHGYYHCATCKIKLLLETIESAIYQLDKLEDLLDMPKRGCTRNHFNALMRTLKEGIEKK